METQSNPSWPIFIQDNQGNTIYLTWERWQHALDHPGMHEDLLESVLSTLRKGRRRQDAYDPAKYKYFHPFPHLPIPYSHVVVVVKYGWQAHQTRKTTLF